MRIILILAGVLLLTPMFAAADAAAPSPKLQALDISAGKWIYHGTTAASGKTRAGTFTWNEDCGWSANRLFLMCSFDNDWSGETVLSLVVDTYNTKDQSYWHYEMFAAGASGAKPFSSRMDIHGNTWTEYGEDDAANGSKRYDRIVYVFTSPTRVKVSIEVSTDGKHWSTFASGVGEKQP